jgi:hypothetical protein
MKKLHVLGCASLLAGLLALAGCDKNVTVAYVNSTQQSRTVDLSEPGMGHEQFVVPPGSVVPVKLRIPKDELPATYQWSAGPDSQGSFTIDRKSKGWMQIDVARGSPPAAEH